MTLVLEVRHGTSLFHHNLEVVQVHTLPVRVHPHHVVLKGPVLKDLVADLLKILVGAKMILTFSI